MITWRLFSASASGPLLAMFFGAVAGSGAQPAAEATLAPSAEVGCRWVAFGPDVRLAGEASARPAVRARALGDAGRADRILSFSGYRWRVKSSSRPVGPGPNYFSDGDPSVWTDEQGRLHLKVIREHDRWWAAEVISEPSFGYGTYRFEVDTNVDALDPNVVLGLFTWSDDPAFRHREIDIEISRWGIEENHNAQFVVQPYTRSRNLSRFTIPRGLPGSVHAFVWAPDRVVFRSFARPGPQPPGPTESIIHEHTVAGSVPRPGGENARINLWLLGGREPKYGREIEVVIRRFSFVSSTGVRSPAVFFMHADGK
jgi:hypothetical protein